MVSSIMISTSPPVFKVTEEWIDKNSRNGSWNSKQLRILGIQWPPVSGWKKRVASMMISAEQAKLFEDLGRVIKDFKQNQTTMF